MINKLIDAAGENDLLRGINYYERHRVQACEKTGAHTYDGKVSGSEGNIYTVHIDTDEPQNSTCTCPHAQRKDVTVCKHMIALYFAANPDEATACQKQIFKQRKRINDVEHFKSALDEMYRLCDCLHIQNPQDSPAWTHMTMRDVLKQELLRMGTFVVMYDQSHAMDDGAAMINELLDTELTVKALQDRDLKNRVEGSYENIPLDIQISVKADAETIILEFFESFGMIVATACGGEEEENHALVLTYLQNLRKCLSRTAFGSLRTYRGFQAEEGEEEREIACQNGMRFDEWLAQDDNMPDEKMTGGEVDKADGKARIDAAENETDGKDAHAGFAPANISQGAHAEEEEEMPSAKTYEELLQELDSLIGLANVKAEVRTMANLVRIRKIREGRGLAQTKRSLHMVFSGNPGTGKTTVARLIAQIYQSLGVLSRGHLVETDRAGLVAGYVGQTALKTAEVIRQAMGGILFIDEAYALAKRGCETDFGQEAIETLLKAMEDNRGNLVVIAAGYTDLMEDFLNSNPGLRSRFSQTLFFEDYDGAQLHEIFRKMCRDAGMIVTEEADERMRTYFYDLYENRGVNFANARDVRNAFEKILARQANRLASVTDAELTNEMLMEIQTEDVAIVQEAKNKEG